MMGLFLTNMQLFTSQDIYWWTGVMWINCGLLWCFYQLFGLSFWRHPFTAEDPLVSKWCNATYHQIWWRNKLIFILDGLRVRTFSANVNFWVNYFFNTNKWVTYLIQFSFGSLLFLFILLVLLLRPGFVLDEVLLQWRLFFFQLRQPFFSMFFPVFIFKADGVCVDGLLFEVREGLSSQLRHFGQTEESKATGQSSKIQVWTRCMSF